MALSSMRFPITQRKAENAGITWAIGSDRIIWDLAWELPLFMERNVLPIHRKKYLENSRTPEKIREKEPPLTREDEMAEFMFLGLRMTRGISKAEFERQFGSEIDAIYGDVLRKYKSMGLLLEENGRIFLSREGIHVSNSVMADFLP